MTVHELTQILGELNKPSKPQITEAILFLQSLQPDPLELAEIVLLGSTKDLGKWIRHNMHLQTAIRLDREIARLRSLKSETEKELNDIILEIGKLTEERKEFSV